MWLTYIVLTVFSSCWLHVAHTTVIRDLYYFIFINITVKDHAFFTQKSILSRERWFHNIDLIIRWGVKRNILWYTVTFFIIFHLKHGIFRPYNQINVPIRLPLRTNPSKLSQPFLLSFLGAIVAHTANVVPVGTPLAAPLLSQSPVSVWRLQSPRRLFFVHNSTIYFNYFGVRFHKKCLKNIINLH